MAEQPEDAAGHASSEFVPLNFALANNILRLRHW
jgi:hypothetical protein